MTNGGPPAPFRQQFDAARDPYTARNALGITSTGGGVPTTRTITAGAGLTGGGDLSADRTLDVGAGTGITVNANDVALTVPVAVTNGGTGATTAAGALTSLGAAPIASPAFTGNPTAPTQGTGDNDTSIATTAFVTAAASTLPQGRLTLLTAFPVMPSNQISKTTLFYTPYIGTKIPLYDGTSMVPTTFAEISIATTDTTKNPAAIGVNKVNDWFVWNDAGTLRLSHGTDWATDTTRGGTATPLGTIQGIIVNTSAITNGPAANRGTYVGTTRSDASSQLDWNFGGLGTGGTAAWFGVWNCYNRVDVATQIKDDTNSWTYATLNTPRAANNSSLMRVNFVCGLAEDCFSAVYACSGNTGTGFSAFGVGFDSSTAFSGQIGFFNTGGTAGAVIASFGSYTTTPQIGWHYFQAMETQGSAGTGTFYGDAGVPAQAQNGFTALLRM